MRILCAILCALLVGCATPATSRRPTLVARDDLQLPPGARHPAQLQSEVMNLADDFISAVADVYGGVESRATDPAKMTFVQAQKTEIALGALSNAVNQYPFSGLMDMVVLITLARHSVDEPGTRQLLGDADADAILLMLRTQEAIAWRLASQYLTAEQTAELRQLIARWRSDNPQQRYIAHVRLVDFLDTQAAAPARRAPTSVFSLLFIDPMAGIDPAVREIEQSRDTAERIFFYVQRMPMILGWQMESLYARALLAPQVTRVLDNTTSLTAATTQFSQATTQLAGTAEAFRQDMTPYRDELVKQVQQAMTAEREATVRQVSESLRTEQQQAVTNMERSIQRLIDQFYERMRWLVLLTVAAALVAVVVYRLLFRRTRTPADAPTAPR